MKNKNDKKDIVRNKPIHKKRLPGFHFGSTYEFSTLKCNDKVEPAVEPTQNEGPKLNAFAQETFAAI